MSRNPTVKFINRYSRKLHRWVAIAFAIPMIIVFVSGVFLQLKKDVAWVQPSTMRGVGGEPVQTLTQILEAAKQAPEAGFESWDDIDRYDFRPDKGVVKVRGKNRWEVQVDTNTGDILQVAYRRSDLIEIIHDGSWFHDLAKLYIFLPNGVVLLALWMTGMYLWILPIWAKRSGRRRRAAAS